MSPHGVLLVSAFLLGAAGKLALPNFTLRIVLISALALPVCFCLYLRELPSALGLLLIAPISAAGATAGVMAGSVVARKFLGPNEGS